MQERGSLSGWIRTYLVAGVLWCVIVNVHAAVTGAPFPLMAASGPSTGMAKAVDVAGIVAREVALWPFDVWDSVLRPILG